MRVAALNDIHGNLPALDAVLGRSRRRSGHGRCGGDVVGGPFPVEVLDRLRASRTFDSCAGTSTAVLEALPSTTGLERRRARLGDDRLATDRAWPLTVELEIDGAGADALLPCDAPADEPIFTRVTPDEDVVRLLGDVDADLVVCGHTHVQFDRQLPRGLRVVNAGSVGMPYEGRRGAFWALLGPSDRAQAHRVRRGCGRGLVSRGGTVGSRSSSTGLAARPARSGRGDARLRSAAWRVATSARLGAGVSDGDASGSGRSSSGSPRSTPTRRSRFVSAPRSSSSSR